MNKTVSKLIISCVLSTSLAALPSYAAVIDQVKSRVDAIKNDTGTLKSRTSALVSKADETVQRLDEVGSTVNSVIAETDVIKTVLEPLDLVSDMKGRLSELQFDPAELIENDALQQAIELFKEQQAQREADQLVDAEQFKQDMLNIIGGIGSARSASSGAPHQSGPLERLLRNAAPQILGMLGRVSGDRFRNLADGVAMMVENVQELERAGVFADYSKASGACAVYGFRSEERYLSAFRAGRFASRLAQSIDYLHGEADEKTKEVEIGIHGYTSLTINVGEKLAGALKILQMDAEYIVDRLAFAREALEHYEGCDPATI